MTSLPSSTNRLPTVVVAHHTRFEAAHQVAEDLRAAVVLDEGDHGSLWGHRNALTLLGDSPGIVLEDDAIPCAGFPEAAAAWARRFPDRLISFYLGTGRPPQWQDAIRYQLGVADAASRDYVEIPRLLFGVGYYVPPGVAPLLASAMEGPADEALSAVWKIVDGRPVIYPSISLVDHADGESVEVHPDGQPRTVPRRAWRFRH